MKVLTGNRLDDGEVVFLSGASCRNALETRRPMTTTPWPKPPRPTPRRRARWWWSTRILIEAQGADGGLTPVSYRERLRALGPTNKPDHGKQALGGADVERLSHAVGAARSKGRVDLIRRK